MFNRQLSYILFVTLTTFLAISPMLNTVLGSSEIEKAAKVEGPRILKAPDKFKQPVGTVEKESVKEDEPESKTAIKTKKIKSTAKGMKPFATNEEKGISPYDKSITGMSTNEEGGISSQNESLVGLGRHENMMPLGNQKRQFIGMGEDEGSESTEDSDELAQPPLTTEELLALEADKTTNSDKEHVIVSLDKAIAKWEKFAAKGGSGTGVLKRLKDLRNRYQNEIDSDSDSPVTEPETGTVANDGDTSDNGEADGLDDSNDTDSHGTDYDDSDEAGNDNGNADNDSPSPTDGVNGYEPGNNETDTDSDEDTEGNSNEADSETQTADADKEEDSNKRDNLAPECSFRVEITKSGIKHGKVALKNFNYFDRADPKTNVASGAKKIRISNDGSSWTEYPADSNLLKRVNWKYGTPDASGNTTIYMQACDNDGNWGNGASDSFKHTFNVQ